MNTSRSSSSFLSDGFDLSLTGSQLSMTKRPSSASPAKQLARSTSVISENKAKRNTLVDAGLGNVNGSGSRAINNLQRSNSTTQVSQQASASLSEERADDFLALFDSSADGRKKLSSLSKTSPEKKTTWNVLDEEPRPFPVPVSGRSTSTTDVPVMTKRRETTPVSLAANFTANNRSNKGTVGNSVTTMLHNNYPTIDKLLTPKSSNQKATSLNNMVKMPTNEENSLDQSSFKKSQKNLSSNNVVTRNNTTFLKKKKEVTEEEAERIRYLNLNDKMDFTQLLQNDNPDIAHPDLGFIQHVNHAVITIQRWYRRHSQRRKASQAALKRLLATKKQEREQEMLVESDQERQRKKSEERKKIREEKARQARKAAIEELQQKRAEKAAEDKRTSEEEIAMLQERGRIAKKKTIKPMSVNNTSPVHSRIKSKNSDPEVLSNQRTVSPLAPCVKTEELQNQPQDVIEGEIPAEEQEIMTTSLTQSKTTLHEVLDTLKLLEEEPKLLPEPNVHKKDKYAWIDGDCDSTSLTADNLEKLGQIEPASGLPDHGSLLSEAKLQSIMSFLDEMEKSEQERPKSCSSTAPKEVLLSEEELSHLEQASVMATEVTSSMIRLKLEFEEKKRAIVMLQTALAQQKELTVRHMKETEREMCHRIKMQKEQYESTIQRHLAFIDQLIDDKKGLNAKCESMVNELKQVDQKYTKKIQQMHEQHELEIKKLKEIMSATEKIRREKWIDEKTKKIKEITVKGLEPEIQKLIAKHKQELKKLKALHEAELLQSDERAAQRYIRQTEELREQLEREKEDLCQRERDLARQRYEKQLEQEEQAIQQQRRRLYAEVAEEKERLNQQAARQRAELDELRRQLEDNSSLVTKALKEEFEKAKEEQERRHQAEIQSLKERLEIEKQAWEENYMKKQEAWLLSHERGLKEEVRKGRDKEIELVIQRLEEEVRVSKQECERVAENTIKHVRHKCESELRELERSERNLQEKCNELKARLMDAEGETIRFKGLFRYKEQEIEDIRKINDRLTEERNSLAEVIRQEFADRLVSTEEENKQLKTEMSEVRARHRLEVERITKEKEEELEEVHKRVKVAIVKKEEAVNNLRKQYEAAHKRADHLEALLEQQRKQLLDK
ncbi:centrosomal protein of 131 kDa isoform X2 [Stegostoma tigrinum]|uniref:centrosomal protein of 131 kDa isoform X2 n=1 Tax=Stegostoma tigrinum TaxID=3053191 RepID=UPI0028700AA2|nr:centrosomal protein of 131 kDa isoform X2 [Stegostoma tigrinum]